MACLELRYVAHIYVLTGRLKESYETSATTVEELLHELDGKYPGFFSVFADLPAARLKLNAMIYYGEPGRVPTPVLDLQHPIRDGATLTFW